MFEMRMLNAFMFSETGNTRNDLILCGVFLSDDCQKSNYFIKIIRFPKENKELPLKGEENTRSLKILQSIACPAPTLQPQNKVKTIWEDSRRVGENRGSKCLPKQKRQRVNTGVWEGRMGVTGTASAPALCGEVESGPCAPQVSTGSGHFERGSRQATRCPSIGLVSRTIVCYTAGWFSL